MYWHTDLESSAINTEAAAAAQASAIPHIWGDSFYCGLSPVALGLDLSAFTCRSTLVDALGVAHVLDCAVHARYLTVQADSSVTELWALGPAAFNIELTRTSDRFRSSSPPFYLLVMDDQTR